MAHNGVLRSPKKRELIGITLVQRHSKLLTTNTAWLVACKRKLEPEWAHPASKSQTLIFAWWFMKHLKDFVGCRRLHLFKVMTLPMIGSFFTEAKKGNQWQALFISYSPVHLPILSISRINCCTVVLGSAAAAMRLGSLSAVHFTPFASVHIDYLDNLFAVY